MQRRFGPTHCGAIAPWYFCRAGNCGGVTVSAGVQAGRGATGAAETNATRQCRVALPFLADAKSAASVIHAAHSAHAAARSRVLQRCANNLRRIDDTLVEHVDVVLALCVEAECLRLTL